MEFRLDIANLETWRDFLQDLVLQVDRPEEVDVLLEILNHLKDTNAETDRARALRQVRTEMFLDRYDIFRMYPDRIVRIGFVKGAENAKRVLPGLNSFRGSVYFLHGSGGA
jgi:hypothetical protein